MPIEPQSTVTDGARGFVPLSDYTGVVEILGPLWPEAHLVSRLELGDSEPDPDDLWLVRSPWESLSVSDVLTVLWRWVERDPFPLDEQERTSRIVEVFGWEEPQAQRLL